MIAGATSQQTHWLSYVELREPSDSLRDYSTRSCFPFSASQFYKIYIYIYIIGQLVVARSTCQFLPRPLASNFFTRTYVLPRENFLSRQFLEIEIHQAFVLSPTAKHTVLNVLLKIITIEFIQFVIWKVPRSRVVNARVALVSHCWNEAQNFATATLHDAYLISHEINCRSIC